ncbi:MAG: DUF2066 domain-containing protein [Methyloprofundus sp.]|nr:DUF2066 domain-containing protein [Methyloprofundus sp.]MDT8426092.1 DUF2066 domain-containing protein [Methyloprofundus sp.]
MKALIKFLLVCYLFSAAIVQAIEVKGLFEVEVAALSQSREDRNAALREAMSIVLNRLVVGDNINQDATVKIALDNAASYVDQYQYELNVNAKAGSDMRIMRVAFNEEMLMELMRSSSLAIWNEMRDEVLVWLVVEQFGQRAILDIDKNRQIEQALQAAAKLKGVPILLPLMDLEEKQKVLVADVLSAYPEKLMKASERYDVAAILSGKLLKQRRCWSSEWTLSFNNKIAQWTVPCLDLAANLAVAFQGAYKPLASFYAVKADQVGMGTVMLKVAGISGMTAETNIKSYLRKLPMVSSVKWVQVEQGRHVFQLKITGTQVALQEYLALGRELREKGVDMHDNSLLYELREQ